MGTVEAAVVAGTRRSRIELLVLLGGLTALSAASTDISVPALPSIAHDLGASQGAAQLVVTAFFAGLAAGQIVAGPLSDVLGRRRPMLAGVALYVLASVACAASPSLPVLVAARLVQGLAAAAGIVISRAVVRDLYAGADTARAFSRMYLVIGLTPMLAPIVGSEVLRVWSWRGVFLVPALAGGLLLGAAAARLPETLPPDRRRSGGVVATARTFGLLLRSRVFVGWTVPVACGVSMFIASIAAAPFVVEDAFGRSPQTFALLYFVTAFLFVATTQLNARLLQTIDMRRLVLLGLLLALAGGVALIAVGGESLWVFFGCLAVVLPSWGFISANGSALAMRDHPEVAGSAAALIGFAQFGCGALAAPLTGIAGNGSVVALGIVVVVLAAIALVAVKATYHAAA
jgi:DHA1 family bicyclomycin/chloramphenicol resistance-like MFS transporter